MPKQRLADKAYEGLIRRIQSGDLQPGNRLTEQQLCKLLRMSRTPIREAINRLAVEGLLQAIPHRGITIRQLSPQEIIELYDIREALESQAARLAAERHAEDGIAALNAIVGQMRQLDPSNPDECLRHLKHLDLEFHTLLLELSESSGLMSLYQRQHLLRLHLFGSHTEPHAREIVRPDRLPRIVAEHQAIADAIASRNADEAESIIRHTMAGAAATHQVLLLSDEGFADLSDTESRDPAMRLVADESAPYG